MSTGTFEVPGLPLPVLVRRVGTARRFRLRIDHDREMLRLTMPARGSARAALLWAGEQRGWVEQQLAKTPRRIELEHGAAIPFRGETLRIHNDDTVNHQLHTNGRPCPHGGLIRPGAFEDCRASATYDGPPLYDHNTNGAFHIRVNP